MGFRRLNIGVNCESAEEVEQAQAILDELSNILRLNAADLIQKAPLIRKNQSVISEMIKRVVSSNGKNFLSNLISAASLAAKIKT